MCLKIVIKRLDRSFLEKDIVHPTDQIDGIVIPDHRWAENTSISYVNGTSNVYSFITEMLLIQFTSCILYAVALRWLLMIYTMFA